MPNATLEVDNPLRERLPILRRVRNEEDRGWTGEPMTTYRADKVTATRAIRNDPLGAMHARGQISDVRYRAGREWQRYAEMAGYPLRSPGDIQEPVSGTRMPRDGTSDRRQTAIAKRAVWRDMLGGRAFALLAVVLEDQLSRNEAGALIFPSENRKHVNWLFTRSLDQVAADLGLTT